MIDIAMRVENLGKIYHIGRQEEGDATFHESVARLKRIGRCR